MKNVTFDTTSFAEQLGLYDFFNVLVYGATFVCGVCVLNESLCKLVWSNPSVQKGLAIVLMIYIIGMLLQEFGSAVDKYGTKLYKGMHGRILKGSLDEKFEKENENGIIDNPAVLKKYRDMSDKVLIKHGLKLDKNRFENEYINGYIFSISQYYVSIRGKDKKVEKLRALFSMSKTLMSSFFLLTGCAVLTLVFNINMSIEICNNFGIVTHGCEHCVDKIIMVVVFFGIGVAFRFRAQRTMRNFLLVLLGTYNAILQAEENDREKTNE